MSKKNDEKKVEEVITPNEEKIEDNNDSTIKKLNEKIVSMQKEIEAFKSIKEEEADKVLRIQAEFQNYKRRKDEETDRMIKFANEGLIESILPTLDNFERAISLDDSNLTDELSKFLEGFKMVYTSFVGVLDNFGLKEINAIDEPFDPTYHQAVLTDKDDTKEDGIVLEVLQKGYMLKDRVVRASMVKVNNL